MVRQVRKQDTAELEPAVLATTLGWHAQCSSGLHPHVACINEQLRSLSSQLHEGSKPALCVALRQVVC